MPIAVPDIGPRHFLLGDPTTALGAGMIAGGLSRNVKIKPSPSFKTGATFTGQENHEAVFYQGESVEVEITVPRSVASGIRSFVPHLDTDGDYATLGASMPKITLALVHPDDAASVTAGASPKTTWFPSVRVSDIGESSYNGNEDGIDDSNYVTITFMAGYIATDQDGSDVPEAALPMFRGDRLATHGMGYVLPTPYGPAS